MAISDDLDVRCTLFWRLPPPRPFETVRDAVRFVMESLSAPWCETATITTDSGMNYDFKDIERAYAALSVPTISPAVSRDSAVLNTGAFNTFLPQRTSNAVLSTMGSVVGIPP